MAADLQGGIAVVGASVAGVAAVEAIRDAGYAGPLHLIDAQPEQPYDRPPLSKQVLADPEGLARIRLRTEDHWGRREVTLHLGTAATRLDVARRALTLADGDELRCSAMVLAPGSEPRPLPFPVSGGAPVHLLRTLDDARRMTRLLDTCRSLVVIGAGFVGLEVASAARRRGIDVTVVDVTTRPLAAAIGAPVAEHLLDLHREAGTSLVLGVGVRSVRRDGGRAVVDLDSGREIVADAVVAGIGVHPAVHWLAGSGLEVGDGLLADGHLWCGDGIFAAGDAVNWPNPVYGGRMRVEHWTTAREQGAAAGTNAAGFALTGRRGEEFAHVPYVWSDQCDRKVQFVGHLVPGATAEVDRRDGRTLVCSHRLGGRLVACTTVNAPKDVMAARRRIRSEWLDLGPVAPGAATSCDPLPPARTLQGALS